ncbi:MAG: hypothetical protein JSU61_11835 [Fidelibacterota bacterium]|nr:MAG: hypothetical protein JSU61_11835 [Candidatus Neomarinimicrobiota bacterium]
MLFKTYTGSSEREALALAKRELGEDIMILDLRRDDRSNASKGNSQQVILRVGVNPRSGNDTGRMNGSSHGRLSRSDDMKSRRNGSLTSQQQEDMAELFLLRQQLRSVKAQLRAVRSCPFLEPFDFCFNTLTEAGVPDNVAELLVTRTEEQLIGMGDHSAVIRDEALAELKRQISYLFYSVPRKRPRSKREVIAVVGPSGAGKTSLIIKMASHPDVYRDRRVGIISTDIFRAGANAGLKSLGDILSIPIIEARQVDDIPRALVNLAKCDVILMDTPGRSPLSKGSLPDLQTQLAVLRPTETLLVLSANMALEELWLFKGLYQGIHPSGLVVTKLDETSKPGKVLALADDPELPMKYVTTGQAVPQSLSIRIPPAVINRLPLAAENI